MSDVPMTHGLDTSGLNPDVLAIVEALNDRLFEVFEAVVELNERVTLIESCFERGDPQA